ncbi:MAG TPA: phosphoribosyl-AMP cyclohydrolase [Candidatus Binatia bacterium]|jgi:phosphoribosyl-AMP cyclohydrolase
MSAQLEAKLEEGTGVQLDFAKLAKIGEKGQHVVPVVLQDSESKDVLYIGYVNDLALAETLKTRRAVLWSTSRNELWRKGETSGDVLELVDVRINCEQNSLLYVVRPTRGGCCHTKDSSGRTRRTCYYRRLDSESQAAFLDGMR